MGCFQRMLFNQGKAYYLLFHQYLGLSQTKVMKAQNTNKPSIFNETTTTLNQGALKLKDSCAYLGGISPSSVRRLIERGLLKPNRALRHILIPIAELNHFINSGGLT